MTTRTLVLTLCDLPHDGDTDAETYTITTPTGAVVELDLCRAHVVELMSPLVDLGRRVKAPRSSRRR